MIVARLGPASAMSAKKMTKVSAEHATPSTTIAPMASDDGTASGGDSAAAGSRSSEAMPSAAATGPRGSPSDR
jgi:hypothetical protein